MNCEQEDKFLTPSPDNFDALALELYRFQYENIPVYQQFADRLKRKPELVKSVSEIPFLPVSFFKTHDLIAEGRTAEIVFSSSGTTGTTPARHPVHSAAIYRRNFFAGFEFFYGPVKDWCILGLLPSYLERSGSSLVYMVGEMISASSIEESGFYLYNFDALAASLRILESRKQKTLLIGVSFALMDFAADFPMPLSHTVIMETGGMKGRKREITRSELHSKLMQAFDVSVIHAEYGMTELLSQAYSNGRGIFECSSTMRILLRQEDDPLTILPDTTKPQTGLVNIIDLANIYSCSFIATDDIGRKYPDGSFEILGRLDMADIRGCSLMVAPDNIA